MSNVYVKHQGTLSKREINIKTTARCKYTELKWFTLLRIAIPNIDENVECWKLLHVVGRSVKWYTHFEKGLEISYKIKHRIRLKIKISTIRHDGVTDAKFTCLKQLKKQNI